MLSTDHGVRGELVNSTVDDVAGKTSLTFERAGTRNEVVIENATGMARNTAYTANFSGFMVALHIAAGIEGNMAPESLWGVAVVCVAVLLVGIVVTGFLMWMRRRGKDKRTGVIFMAMSLLYCVVILTAVRLG